MGPGLPTRWLLVISAIALWLVVSGLGEGRAVLASWLGAAWLIYAAPEWGAVVRRQAWAGALRERAPALSVVGLFALLLAPTWWGHPPASRDHAIHYLQSAVFVEQVLEYGRWRGPSFALNTGYPFGDSYPVLGYALTSALHLISGGLIPLRVSYALGIAVVWAVHAWALWALGRRTFVTTLPEAPSHYAGWAGAAAAAFFLLDPGASREGGWTYAMFHGVWPQLLSTGLFLASLELGLRAMARPSARRTALFTAAWAASVAAHPFGWITGAMALPGWPLWWALGRKRGQFPPGSWRVWAIATPLLLSIVAHPVTVFLASRGAMARVPVPWAGLPGLSWDLLRGELFSGAHAIPSATLVLGAGIALRYRGWVSGSLLAAFGLGLVLASREAITVLRLDLIVPGLENLQFPRYAFLLKGLAWPLAGLGLAWAAWAGLEGRPPRRSGEPVAGRDDASIARARGLQLPRAALALALAPVLAGLVGASGAFPPRPVGATETPIESEAGPANDALRASLTRELETQGTIGRVAFLRQGMSGATYPLFALVDAGLSVALDGHVPSINYRHRLRARSPSALRAMGVTHVLWSGPLGPRDEALIDQLEEIGSEALRAYGWRLARLAQGTPRDTPWARVRKGAGRIDIQPDGDSGDFILELDRAARPTQVEVAVGPYRSWRLRDAQGEAIPWTRANLVGGVPGMRATLSAGRYRLRWERNASERRSAWVSALGWLLCGGLFILGGRPWSPARDRWPRISPRQGWLLLAVGVLLLASLNRFQQHRLARTWSPLFEGLAQPEGGLPSGVPLDLVDDGALWVDPSETQSCSGVAGRDPKADCDAETHGDYRDFLFRRPHLYRCLSIEVAPGQRRALRSKRALEHRHFVAVLAGSDSIRISDAGDHGVRADPGARRRLHFVAGETIEPGRPLLWVDNEGDAPERVCVALAAK